MKKLILLILLFVLQNNFGQTKSNFKVLGNIKNLNNQYIYFSYEGSGKERKWDSVKIKNNKFFFSGFITESKNGFLTTLKNNRVNDLSDPEITDRIFLDPSSTMKINIEDSNNFHKAKISGSKSQVQYEKYSKIVKKESDYNGFIKRYIHENFNTYFGLYLLKSNGENFPFIELNNFYENLNPDLRNSEYGISLLNLITKLSKSMPGKKAINFYGSDLNNNTISLSDFDGKYILLDFWASWCKPCREKNPLLIELFQKYTKKGFTIIGIADDIGNEDKWRKAILKDKIDGFTQIIDSSEIGKKYAVPYLPTQILIDREGNIIHRYDDINEPIENLKIDLQKIFKE